MFYLDCSPRWCHFPRPRAAANAVLVEVLRGKPVNPSNVRLLRRAHEADRTRFVLSGKLIDVCRELDRLAAQEAVMSRRHVGL